MKKSVVSQDLKLLKFLPSVDLLLQTQTAQSIHSESGGGHLTTLAREAVNSVRETLTFEIFDAGDSNLLRNILLKKTENQLLNLYISKKRRKLLSVINATGVMIHTNLGRAPISKQAKRTICENAFRYCNLEYDLETGKRGKRGGNAEEILTELTGAESALIVNNCAAACVLILAALAKGGEVILSRGEMVEIGGDFRIPDVLLQSGAILKEVGTTNRTKISDYEKAVNENTRMILKVHPSNYRIIGFTETPSISKLSELAQKKNILLFEDAGSGMLCDLSEFGLADEPLIPDSIKAGADLVTFSGDKLLGAVQSGFIVGKKEIVEKLRSHPLYRVLRVDKIAYAAIAATLEIFQQEKQFEQIPVLNMLSKTYEEMQQRASDFCKKLANKSNSSAALETRLIDGNSAIGGGSAPTVNLKTVLISLKHSKLSAPELEKYLRFSTPPVISRIANDQVVIDLRTVFEDEEEKLLEILSALK